jgi:putative peptidoglycan lipid II flippase
MLISLGSIAVNYAMNSLLVGPFGHVGLAFSTSTVALLNFLLLALFMRRKLQRLGGRRLLTTVLKIIAASTVMAAVAGLVDDLASALPLRGFALNLARVGAAIAAAGAVFYLACRRLGVEELSEAVEAIAGRLTRALR